MKAKNFLNFYFYFLLINLFLTEALRFYVSTNEKRCLKEEIHKNVVMTGDYEISDSVGHTMTVIVSFIF
jgi:p24 family protein delta-1